MKITLLLIIVLSVALKSNAQKTLHTLVEYGVSEKLAVEREKVLSQINYCLTLQIPPQKEQPISASEIINVSLSDNNLPLQIDFKSTRNSISGISVNDKAIALSYINEHILIDPKYLKTGHNAIHIVFTAGDLSLNRNADFLYTLLVPDRARTVFPCFDQPDLKATFSLSLTIPTEWLAVANAPLLDSSLAMVNKTLRYVQSDTISTYLFSFVAGKFTKVSKVIDGRTMNFYHRETDTNKINFSIDSIFKIHGDAIKFLESYTQIPYPFKKFDFVAIPDFQYGGMEHVGVIDYKASSLFLDSGSTKDQENARTNLIAHETSHMWFGDLVTMQWFNDVWMKEVFANFMADKVGQVSQANSNYELKFLIDHFPAAYSVDRTLGANPIRQQLSNLKEAGTLYGNIIYHKAPVMMRQLERLMGKEAFRDGLREYLAKYRFHNATWPDLISILTTHTAANLNRWNKVWVNEPGRPVIDYKMEVSNGKIATFKISQRGEHAPGYVLPQFFEIALLYGPHVDTYIVHMDGIQTILNEVEGKPVPDHIIFNSSGEGYGLFPVDTSLIWRLSIIQSPVMRASAYISLYENMLSGRKVTPLQLLRAYETNLSIEPEELNLKLITGHIADIFWRLISPAKRVAIAPVLEERLWKAMQADSVSNRKKIIFRTFQSIAITKQAKDRLFSVWQSQRPPTGIKLTEEDYTSIALTLAVKDYPIPNILEQQLARIKNIDRRNRLLFLMAPLSGDVKKRDAFFASLKDEKNREKEAWVATALDYLHHPLRAATSKKYLGQSLELLQEIQLTGDIFFPGAWLQSSFGSYQSKEVADIVRKFLRTHPNYNPKLKAKILQATDPLFRAEKLV
ncbi:MAG: M1 family aminopeptidase, partial [Bacteroidota bacterium]|nr:M1 family aminopeptidase [Bacteroidota bacterium]